MNEYYLKGYNIHQMIVSFMILKEKYFNLFVYDNDEKNNNKNYPRIGSTFTRTYVCSI